MSAPIIGIVGPNGGGKSLCAVEHYARPALERGRLVVSTMDIDGAELLRSHREIPTLRSCVLILDEISSAFPSRESSGMPAEIVRRLNQLRKVDVQVVWTAPAWERADKVLREVTNQVVLCRGMMPRYPWESTCPATCPTPTILAFERRYERRLSGQVCPTHKPRRDRKGWPSNRLFSWRWFSAEMLQEFSLTQISHERGRARRRPQAVKWYRMPPAGTGAPSMYRTLDEVVLLDHLDTYGNCFSCGGSRRRPKCECERVDDSLPRIDGEADQLAVFRRELENGETLLGPVDLPDHPSSDSSDRAS